ncbi:MAG: M4 family metallopeptidase, partial [Chloroflexi bacterium]|nr:M4 family metallopeptidase [Chloroflexota bacterium]
MKTKLNRIISALLIAIIASANIPQTGLAVESSQTGKDGTQVGYNPDTGNVAFIGGGSPISVPGVTGISAMSPQDKALAIANTYAPQFGLQNPSQDLSLVSEQADAGGGNVVRYQQTYQGVPVLAGELIVNMSQSGELLSISGEVSQNPTLDINPVITADEAGQTALAAIAKWYQADAAALTVSQPELRIFDESLLKSSTRPPELVWFMRVSATDGQPIREVAMVNAQTGGVSLHYSEIDTIGTSTKGAGRVQPQKPAVPSAAGVLGSPLVSTYTMSGSTSPLPGTFVCNQSTPGCTNGANPDADNAQQYALDTYNFYQTRHGRDSIDNAGMTIISSVQYDVNYQNAFWNGAQMVYGDGFPADDVVGHELTHGVTDYTSGLFYLYQSGAINESFSDVWGEFIDQTNGRGNDSPSVKWLLGEDLSIGAIRSMSNPPAYGDPDRIGSPNFYTGSGDNGGVHYNSGVNNKAAYLMTDGGTFNGQTVTGIGLIKTAAIYYEVQTNLLGAGANYTDLYFALNQACLNLTGGADGITSGDCTQVKNAALAVEMNVKPSQTFTPNPDFCPTAGNQPVNIFFDNMESGSANWAYGATGGFTNNWGLVSPGISSPTQSLFGPDVPLANDSYAAMSADATLPGNTSSYLYFNHVFDFEFGGPTNQGFDGGVLEYSTNQGASWNDAQPLFSAGQNYNTTLYPPSLYSNPLGGRAAFSGTSNGMVASRYDLTSLAGQRVRFRWRIGSDYIVGKTGWFVDDVRIYRCPTNTNVYIGGVLKGSYDVPSKSRIAPLYPGINNGPVQVVSTNGAPIITSERAYRGANYTDWNEMMGFPA